jgi:hypothetical protein
VLTTKCPGDEFGTSFTTLDDRLVVGAPGLENFGPALPGRVYVMDVRGQVDLIIENPTPNGRDLFDSAVAMLGANIFFGAPGDDAGGDNSGAA